MNVPDTYFLWLLVAANAMLLAVATAAILGLRRHCRRLERDCRISEDTPASMAESTHAGEKLLLDPKLEQRLSGLQRSITKLAAEFRISNTMSKSPVTIDAAIRMAKRGASADQLTRFTGLNTGEAALVKKLHARPNPTAAAARN